MRISCTRIRIVMARLNVYLPDELYELANQWRGTLNLSDICARALREEISAVDSSRITVNLSNISRKRSSKENKLVDKFGLQESFVIEASAETSMRDDLGAVTAGYLDRWLSDGAQLALAGGRQTWSVIRHLSPRNVRVSVTALGYGHQDAIALHTHPNTLLTLAWLLYAPRAQAHLVGSSKFNELWKLSSTEGPLPRYFIVASCSCFSATSPFAVLIGKDSTADLLARGVVGDFGYVFFGQDGQLIEAPSMNGIPQSTMSPIKLQTVSRRTDARVILIAGGPSKATVALWALTNKLCNMLVVDSDLADQLLAGREVVTNVA